VARIDYAGELQDPRPTGYFSVGRGDNSLVNSDDASWVDSMPGIYDRCLGPALFAPYAEHLAAVVAAIAAPPSPRLLELAAGTGIATNALVDKLPTASVTATDLNPTMVEYGSARVPTARWTPANAQQLAYPDDSFDLVVCQFGVMFFPDRPGAFAEMGRVLAPTGTVVFTVWDEVEGSDFAAAMVDSLAVVFPDNPPAFIVRVPHGYADTTRIEQDLRAGGLRVNSIDRVVLPSHATSAQSLAEGYCLGTPLRFALEERGPLEAFTRRLSEEMTARLGAGPVDGQLAAFVIQAGHGD
jgi:SAM-dependent methyltransferase